MRYLFTHVRNKNNVPYATVAGTVENGRVLLGWARCNMKEDQFSKKLGREVAAGRAAISNLSDPNDRKVREALDDMYYRVQRYFRLEVVEEVAV